MGDPLGEHWNPGLLVVQAVIPALGKPEQNSRAASVLQRVLGWNSLQCETQ